jgi:hypothetical protein
MDVKTLGIDQLKWLTKFRTIFIEQWRIMHIDKDFVGWVYVGEEYIKHYNDDNEFMKIKNNLLSNRYYYWPS